MPTKAETGIFVVPGRGSVILGVPPANPAPAAPAPAGAPAAPAAPAPPPPPQFTPGEVAQMAMDKLTIVPPEIGSAPCHDSADCKGAVGLPVWLWTNPWETQTATATAAPYTVTATATPMSVDWDMGDGGSVHCTTAGTPFEPSMGFTQSPDCGYEHYVKKGDYTITATMTVQVQFSGDYVATQDVTVQSSVPVAIREYQALITR